MAIIEDALVVYLTLIVVSFGLVFAATALAYAVRAAYRAATGCWR